MVILGLIQGLAEFIPVSSSGHLAIAQHLMGVSGDGAHLFLEFVNLGTLAALLIFYRRKIWQICVDIVKRHNWRLARNVLLTAIPAGLIGLLLANWIEHSDWLGALVTVAIAMGVVGVLMIIVEKLPKLSAVRNGERLSAGRALAIGCAQVMALIPGVSRSGSTILAGRVVGLDSREAADYSFLASIPIMVGVTLKLFLSSSDRAYFVNHLDVIVVSNLVAFVAGVVAIKFVLGFLKREGSLQKFGWYRVIVASVLLVIALV